MNFLHAGVTGRQGGRVATPPRPAGRQPSGGLIDWRSVRRAEHSCCCTAKPAVIAIMPPTAGRPHLTELLLCWHHYRVSRKSLDAAGATVLDLAGEPVGDCSWPRAR
jgi:hypothetical protein